MSETINHSYQVQRAAALTDSFSGRHLAGYNWEKEKAPEQYKGSIRLDEEAEEHDDEVQEAMKGAASSCMGDDLSLQSPCLSTMLVTLMLSFPHIAPVALRCVRGACRGRAEWLLLSCCVPVVLSSHEPGSAEQLWLGFMPIQWEGQVLELNIHWHFCLLE